jgi:excisionase family DNA binding protein
VDGSLAQLLITLRQTETVQAEAISEVLGELERLRCALLVRMITEGIRGAVLASKIDSSARPEELVTVKAAALQLNLSRGHLYELIRRRQFPVIKSGKSIRIQVRRSPGVDPPSSRRSGRQGRAKPSLSPAYDHSAGSKEP